MLDMRIPGGVNILTKRESSVYTRQSPVCIVHVCYVRKLKDAPLVVVIGAGFAGLTVAQKLESEFNVLVLEAKDALYFQVGAMRATCDREFASKILLPYTNALKYGKIAKGS